jgi:CDP-diacylglycerol--glycerol-3-phosphate 3-phosphatidyltransferase
VNLPNAISAARIAVSPLIALLPLVPSPLWRTFAFVLYVVSAVSDYVDGWLARTRGLITDLGKTLDPLADKLLLVATFVPMLILQGAPSDAVSAFLGSVLFVPPASRFAFPFVTWFGTYTLPWWVVVVVIGREAFMTIFRQVASGRGVVIAAIWPAKWKAGMQYVWVGAAYFWFAAQTLALHKGWSGSLWSFVSNLTGLVGVATMSAAVLLTFWSLVLYLRRHGALIAP